MGWGFRTESPGVPGFFFGSGRAPRRLGQRRDVIEPQIVIATAADRAVIDDQDDPVRIADVIRLLCSASRNRQRKSGADQAMTNLSTDTRKSLFSCN